MQEKNVQGGLGHMVLQQALDCLHMQDVDIFHIWVKEVSLLSS